MRLSGFLSTFVALLAALLLPALALGCGPDKQPAKVAKVKPKPMPDGAEWTGVYYSALFGELHMVQEGNLVNGKWVRPVKGRWGKLQGNADSNVLKFDWDEYVDGLIGPNSKKSGKGYFVYSRPEGDNVDDVIEGQVGRGDDELGVEWKAVKQRNVDPKLDSIGGVGASEVGGGDWDSDNTESGDPEPPAKPDVKPPEL